MTHRKQYLAELIGTFALVFFGTGAVVVNDLSSGLITHPGIALAFGLVVMAVVYALGDVSGAHINPAVTIGFWAAGRFDRDRIAPYIASQLIGALLASLTLRFLFPTHTTLGATIPAGGWGQSFILELILTTILMLVILAVSTGANENSRIGGLVIGSVVGIAALFAGPICGASMNPARSLGPAIASMTWDHQWIYLTAPFVGAVAGVFVCRCTHPTPCCPAKPIAACR